MAKTFILKQLFTVLPFGEDETDLYTNEMDLLVYIYINHSNLAEYLVLPYTEHVFLFQSWSLFHFFFITIKAESSVSCKYAKQNGRFIVGTILETVGNSILLCLNETQVGTHTITQSWYWYKHLCMCVSQKWTSRLFAVIFFIPPPYFETVSLKSTELPAPF